MLIAECSAIHPRHSLRDAAQNLVGDGFAQVGEFHGIDALAVICANQDHFISDGHARNTAHIDSSEVHGNASHDRRILAANELRDLVQDIVRSRRKNKPVILMMGAHVIKVGLSPLIIDLVHRGIITHVAMNSAASIHDVETAIDEALPGRKDLREFRESGLPRLSLLRFCAC